MPRRPKLVDDRGQLLQGPSITGHRVAFSVVKQEGRILVAHAVKRHCSMYVGIVAADDMAAWNIYDGLALVGKQHFHFITRTSDRRPASEENRILKGRVSRMKYQGWGVPGLHLRIDAHALIRRGRPSSSNRRFSSSIKLAATVAPSE